MIERAVILGNGRRLEIAEALGSAPFAETPPAAPADVQPFTRAGNAIASLDTAIRQHIESTLTATFGRVEGPFGAARLLGVNPHTLRSRMRKLGIDRTRFRAGPSQTTRDLG